MKPKRYTEYVIREIDIDGDAVNVDWRENLQDAKRAFDAIQYLSR